MLPQSSPIKKKESKLAQLEDFQYKEAVYFPFAKYLKLNHTLSNGIGIDLIQQLCVKFMNTQKRILCMHGLNDG